MVNHLFTIIAVVCALSPFLLVILASPAKKTKKTTETNILIYEIIKKVILISAPVWLPIIYIGLNLLEIEVRGSKAFTFGKSYLANYLICAVPAGWAIAICRNSKLKLLLSIALIPPLYVAGMLTIAVVGWISCDATNLCK
ncbi:hypothetical protein ACT048_21960 [Ectopseudomonas khazarica]|uniref:hypothetical protein n=1 Tax=Ectopseudomonas khazarica TaxID=2502979 RepID=UPI004033D11E